AGADLPPRRGWAGTRGVQAAGGAGGGAPAGQIPPRLPYDLDVRWGVKRDTFWNGYKIHVTETCAREGAAGTGPADAARPGQPRAGADPRAPGRERATARRAPGGFGLPLGRAAGLLPGRLWDHAGHP